MKKYFIKQEEKIIVVKRYKNNTYFINYLKKNEDGIYRLVYTRFDKIKRTKLEKIIDNKLNNLLSNDEIEKYILDNGNLIHKCIHDANENLYLPDKYLENTYLCGVEEIKLFNNFWYYTGKESFDLNFNTKVENLDFSMI